MATRKLLLLSADKDSELFKTISKFNIGLVSEFGDIDTLTKLLTRALEDNELAGEISGNAATYAGQFDRQRVLSNVLQKIENL